MCSRKGFGELHLRDLKGGNKGCLQKARKERGSEQRKSRSRARPWEGNSNFSMKHKHNFILESLNVF
jgi:hypothetical protein